MKAGDRFPDPPRDNAAVIIASDFYTSLDKWRERLAPIAGRCRDGVLLQVCDPIEESYPFQGRIRFHRPGEERQRIIGRAQSIRDGYLERFTKRRADMVELAAEFGWRFITHNTNAEVQVPLGELAWSFTDGAPG